MRALGVSSAAVVCLGLLLAAGPSTAGAAVAPTGGVQAARAVDHVYTGQYSDPEGVAPLTPAGGVTDADGNRYVADSGADKIVRLSPGGQQSTVSATGWQRPRDITLDPSTGRLWVTDTTDNQIVSLERDGRVVSTFGGAGYVKAPFGIAVDDGGVYVADTYNNRVFKLRKSDGVKLWTQGSCNGALSRPRDVAVGSDGRVYVADTDHNRITVLAPATGACERSFGSAGAKPGQFRAPRSLTSDGGGGLWVAEAQAPRLQHVTNQGASLGVVGSYGSGQGRFRAPACVFTDGQGAVAVCDTFEYVIQRFSAPPSGNPSYAGSLGGVRPVAGGFNQPFGVRYGPSGELYVSDMFNHRMQRRSPTGAWSEWGGFGTRPGSFQFPRGLDVSPDGRTVVVTNSENDRIDLYSPDGTLMRSVRPTGQKTGWPHQTGLAADGSFWLADTNKNRVLHLSPSGAILHTITTGIRTPRGLTLDPAGNVYVSNSGANQIRKYSPSGVLLATLATAGKGATQVRGPWNLDVEGGNLYIADGNNNRVVVMTTDGAAVDTFGSGGSGPGQLSSPRSVAVDPVTGTVAVGDFNNNRVSLWSTR
jgi:DNA-binding beta-propeller fold protein YncE